jgi:alkylhydroperoxidase family enzyme
MLPISTTGAHMSDLRIPPTPITGPLGYLVKRFSRKMLGQVPESMGVMWHNRAVLMGLSGLGRKVQKWDRLDANLKSFAHMAVAAQIGCSFCLDFGYFQAYNDGLDLAKASEVPRWRSSTVFTPLERDVMEYAEAMTVTPPQVTDELSARLLELLGAPALLELTAVVGFANQTARSNTALGIESEGFSKVCPVPLAQLQPA